MNTARKFVFFTSADTQIIVGGVSQAGAPVAGNAWVTLDCGDVSAMLAPAAARRRKLVLHSIDVLRASGASATAHTAIVADVTGAASTAWAAKYVGGAVAAATRFTADGINRPMHTSTAGKLFFTPGGDAADTFDYVVVFEVLQ